MKRSALVLALALTPGVSWAGYEGPPVGALTVLPGGSTQSALDAAAALGGGTVYVKNGSYSQTTTLVISSNTRLVCEPGATITANGGAWVGAHQALVNNANWSASTVTDHDIGVEGCNFVAGGAFAANGGFHHVELRKAAHVRVTNRNNFTGGGDGTAMLATIDSVVSDNSMTGATNACWDHWEAPTQLTVRNNFCTTTLYGVLATGTDTSQTLSGQAVSGEIIGNYVSIGAGSSAAGVWLNGLGASGSGASQIKVSDNTIVGDGIVNVSCIKVSGASSDDIVTHNTCKNFGPHSIGFASGSDSGGAPSNATILGNIFESLGVQASDVAVIQLNGPGMSAYENRVTGGAYPSCLWLGSSADVALLNKCDPGTGSQFNLSGATAPVASSGVGALSLIGTSSANNSAAAIAFTALPSGFSSLLLDCNGILPASNNTSAYLQLGEGSSPTWESAGYHYSASANAEGTVSSPFSASSANIPLYATYGLSSSSPLSLKAWISVPSGQYTLINYSAYYLDAVGAPNVTWLTGAGVYAGDVNPITALRVGVGTGNIASGSCSLYGLSPT